MSDSSTLFLGLEFHTERWLIKLLQDRPVEAFIDVIGLRMTGFGAGVLNVVERKEGMAARKSHFF